MIDRPPSIALSLLLPTYNRSEKLGRALAAIAGQVEGLRPGEGPVEVVVCDNASTDSTADTVARFIPGARLRLNHHRQARNVGMDQNIRDAFSRATGEFTWLLSDDDLLKPQAVARVLHALATRAPDLMLLGFEQPPGAPSTFAELAEPLDELRPAEQIRWALRFPKITTYVLRRRSLPAPFTQTIGSQYDFLSLTFDVLAASPAPRLSVLPEVFASCDPGWRKLRFPASTWAGFWRVAEHPFAQQHLPGLLPELKAAAVSSQLAMLWAWRTGALEVEDPADYEQATRALRLPWERWRDQPLLLARGLLLKTLPGPLLWPLGFLRRLRRVRGG